MFTIFLTSVLRGIVNCIAGLSWSDAVVKLKLFILNISGGSNVFVNTWCIEKTVNKIHINPAISSI